MVVAGKTLRKGELWDEDGKRRKKCQQPVHDQSLTAEKSWVMVMYQTDKEHEDRIANKELAITQFQT